MSVDSTPHISPEELAEALEAARAALLKPEGVGRYEETDYWMPLLSRALLSTQEQFEAKQKALTAALDAAIWLSALIGNPDGATDPKVAETWENVIRPKLFGCFPTRSVRTPLQLRGRTDEGRHPRGDDPCGRS